MVAAIMLGRIMVRVRAVDVNNSGQLKPGAAKKVLNRARDMALRTLANRLGVGGVGVENQSPKVVRSADEARETNLSELEAIQGQRRATGKRPKVSLAELLRQAEVSGEKMETLTLNDLFAVMLTDADRVALFRALDDADRVALFRALDAAGRAALFGVLGSTDRAALFRALDDAGRVALFGVLDDADRVALFWALNAADRATLKKTLDVNSALALAFAIIERGAT